MTEQSKHSWIEAWTVYTRREVFPMLFLGFSAGLPYLLVFSTLTAWLTDYGVSRSTIGFFAWVGITYSIKVFWAPLVDGLRLPWLTAVMGKRRSWMLVAQLGMATGLFVLSGLDPAEHLQLVALIAVLIAFSSATQDIAIDAFRIEAAAEEYQGAMSAAYILGYRLALLVAGAGSLYIADQWGWQQSYAIMGLLVFVGVVTVLLVPEPAHLTDGSGDATEVSRELTKLEKLQGFITHSVVAPFREFFQRLGWFSLLVLVFIGLFRVSDITMGVMANPFYLDLGFSKSEIATVVKVFGFAMTIAGSALCGVFVVRLGFYWPLLVGAILVAFTNLLFVVLAQQGADLMWLSVVISADNLSGGIANTAFIAYLSHLTNKHYTATQYALFSSLMTLPGKFISGFSGLVVDGVGYEWFFSLVALVGVPAILLALLLLMMSRRNHPLLTTGSNPV